MDVQKEKIKKEEKIKRPSLLHHDMPCRSLSRATIRTRKTLRPGKNGQITIRYTSCSLLLLYYEKLIRLSLCIHGQGENRRELSTEDKLAFYSLLMQSTEGKCNTSRPGMMNFVERKKWDAWNALGDMSSEEVYCLQNWMNGAMI